MKRTMLALAAGLMAGGAWAGCDCEAGQKAAGPASATEATVTAGGLVDAAIAAEPAKLKNAGKKSAKPAAEAKYECPSCKMAFDKPGACPMCKTALVPKKTVPKKS